MSWSRRSASTSSNDEGVLQAGVIQTLTGDTFRFWSDPAQRERMLRDILDARGRQARAQALQAVDDAVSRGKAVLGFQRAPLRSLSLVLPGQPDVAGEKYPSSDLHIGLPTLRRALGPGGAPDAVVETWIHESVHGRHFPWSARTHAEIAFPGYEEGLAEGITHLLSRLAGFVPGLPAYGRYTQTYEELAQVLGVTPEILYRSLYQLTNGSVMDGFVTEIDGIHMATGHPPLTLEQRGRLERTARRFFDIVYQDDPASARFRRAIRTGWRRALI